MALEDTVSRLQGLLLTAPLEHFKYIDKIVQSRLPPEVDETNTFETDISAISGASCAGSLSPQRDGESHLSRDFCDGDHMIDAISSLQGTWVNFDHDSDSSPCASSDGSKVPSMHVFSRISTTERGAGEGEGEGDRESAAKREEEEKRRREQEEKGEKEHERSEYDNCRECHNGVSCSTCRSKREVGERARDHICEVCTWCDAPP